MEQIILKYAYPLDTQRRDAALKMGWKYPSLGETRTQVELAKEWWSEINENNRLLGLLEKLSGFKLPYPLEAYLIGGAMNSTSHPLIVTLYKHDGVAKSKEGFTETIIHEITHRYVGDEDFPKIKSFYSEFIKKEFEGESASTQNHIMVYVFLKKILEEFFGKENVYKYINLENSPDYKKAWDIAAEREEELFNKFRELTN